MNNATSPNQQNASMTITVLAQAKKDRDRYYKRGLKNFGKRVADEKQDLLDKFLASLQHRPSLLSGRYFGYKTYQRPGITRAFYTYCVSHTPFTLVFSVDPLTTQSNVSPNSVIYNCRLVGVYYYTMDIDSILKESGVVKDDANTMKYKVCSLRGKRRSRPCDECVPEQTNLLVRQRVHFAQYCLEARGYIPKGLKRFLTKHGYRIVADGFITNE